ncbi:hypothetical protein L2E82_39232 [Cichorium intybus]|uniref:Uncharacterized protein n=1 Tax=Cichorium intybus TaxID=13427 RepID=A0ACB9AIJ3_CICIN|nr:hypothetical protein L2E82_39232 [Cichorium intybus]
MLIDSLGPSNWFNTDPGTVLTQSDPSLSSQVTGLMQNLDQIWLDSKPNWSRRLIILVEYHFINRKKPSIIKKITRIHKYVSHIKR